MTPGDLSNISSLYGSQQLHILLVLFVEVNLHSLNKISQNVYQMPYPMELMYTASYWSTKQPFIKTGPRPNLVSDLLEGMPLGDRGVIFVVDFWWRGVRTVR